MPWAAHILDLGVLETSDGGVGAHNYLMMIDPISRILSNHIVQGNRPQQMSADVALPYPMLCAYVAARLPGSASYLAVSPTTPHCANLVLIIDHVMDKAELGT